MTLATGIAIFLTIWWTALFAILPLGTRTYAESGIEVKDGGDPGAQYSHDVWNVNRGFSAFSINAIAQTPDGYL